MEKSNFNTQETVAPERGIPGEFRTRELLSNFEKARIDMSAYAHTYRDGNQDMARVSELHRMYEQQSTEVRHGDVAQALILERLEKGALGSGISVRAASLYDDYLHGADIVLDAALMREPIVGSIDVTVNQQMISEPRSQKMGSKEGESRPEGFEKKLERVRRHLDGIASMTQGEARNLAAWMASGGLSGERTRENEMLFRKAERALLLKYYDAPEGHPMSGRPHPVVAGPQVVLSLDSVFINHALTDIARQASHEQKLDALVAFEVAGGIQAYKKCVGDMMKTRGANALLEQYWVAASAWEQLLDRDGQRDTIERALGLIQKDRELSAQAQHYARTIGRVFG